MLMTEPHMSLCHHLWRKNGLFKCLAEFGEYRVADGRGLPQRHLRVFAKALQHHHELVAAMARREITAAQAEVGAGPGAEGGAAADAAAAAVDAPKTSAPPNATRRAGSG